MFSLGQVNGKEPVWTCDSNTWSEGGLVLWPEVHWHQRVYDLAQIWQKGIEIQITKSGILFRGWGSRGFPTPWGWFTLTRLSAYGEYMQLPQYWNVPDFKNRQSILLQMLLSLSADFLIGIRLWSSLNFLVILGDALKSRNGTALVYCSLLLIS